jgi:hypothetical protein
MRPHQVLFVFDFFPAGQTTCMPELLAEQDVLVLLDNGFDNVLDRDNPEDSDMIRYHQTLVYNQSN